MWEQLIGAFADGMIVLDKQMEPVFKNAEVETMMEEVCFDLPE